MINRTTNGLTVATKEMPHMESVSFGIWIRTGVRYENAANNGVSHLLEHLLFKGTETRDMKKIKEEIEGRGGSFNGFTSEEFTCYLVKLLSKDAELGVDILSDMVLNPRLDEKEVIKEKSVVIEEINMYKDIPAQHVHEILTEMLWPGQPLGFPLAGSVESVKALERKDIMAYKESHYNPANMLLIGTGRLKGKDLVGLAGKYLSGPAPKEAPSYEKIKEARHAPAFVLNFKKTEQVHMAMGFHSLDRFDPDKYAMGVLNIILGGNMSSRLFHTVRDELALCYEISSSTRKYYDTGAFVIGAGLEEKKVRPALEVIFKQLNAIKKESVRDEELERAKEFYRGQLSFALEDTMSYMLWLGEKAAAGEKEFEAKNIMARVEAVTKEDIMRVASKIFKDDNLNLAVIGPIGDEKGLKEAVHL